MSLIHKPGFWIGIAALGGIAWFATAPQDTGKLTTKKPTSRKSPSKKGQTVFVRDDYEANFKPVNIQVRNSFQPIVARRSGALGSGEGFANMVPAEFAGGDSGWMYTGSAEINGVRNALLENRATGEGVFLKAGERWKSAVVESIQSDSVVMRGPTGTRTFTLPTEPVSGSLAGGYAPLKVQVSPELRGTIGRGGNANNQRGNAMMMPGNADVSASGPMGGIQMPVPMVLPEDGQ